MNEALTAAASDSLPAPPGRRWMSKQSAALGSKTIAQVCLPGTHDSATRGLSRAASQDDCGIVLLRMPGWIRGAAMACLWPVLRVWSVTQPLPVAEQLALGVRYLDLRASCDDGGDARAAHGTMGVALEQVFREVAAFLADERTGAAEVVVLDVNHMYGFESADYETLVALVLRALGPFIVREDAALLPLAELLASPRMQEDQEGAGPRCIVCLSDEGKGSCAEHVSRCEWLCHSDRMVRNPWPNVPTAQALKERLDGVHAENASASTLHVTQLVLTIGGGEIARGAACCCLCGGVGPPSNIKQLDAAVTEAAPGWLREWRGRGHALNVVLMDWVDGQDEGSLRMLNEIVGINEV